MSLADWEAIGKSLSEAELLDILMTDEYEPEAWRIIAALGFLCLRRGEIGLAQIEALTASGMDLISLDMFEGALTPPDGDNLADMVEG